jgi:hypothetical protein
MAGIRKEECHLGVSDLKSIEVIKPRWMDDVSIWARARSSLHR